MKRAQELINQLKEQLEQGETPARMLATAQLLEAELSRQAGLAAANRGSAKVAVMMPSAMKMYAGQEPFNTLTDVPTLAHQPGARELNDVIGNNGASLNDKLKADVVDLASALNG